MSKVAKVVKALDDSRTKRIDYLNRFWLHLHGRCLKIHVSKELVFVNSWDVLDAWKHENSILVQEGRELTSLAEFKLNKEALLIVERNKKHDSIVYLYVPYI